MSDKQIYCTNGSKDGKHKPNEKFNCTQKNCFNNSTQYCNSSSKLQFTIIIIIVVVLFLLGMLNYIIGKLPFVGGIGVFLFNLFTIIILFSILYVYHRI